MIIKLRSLVAKHGLRDVLDAIRAAADVYLIWDADDFPTSESAANAWAKIPGCARVIQEERGEPALRKLFYIRGILRNRLEGYGGRYDHEFLPGLLKMVAAGYSVEDIQSAACSVYSITQFRDMVKAGP